MQPAAISTISSSAGVSPIQATATARPYTTSPAAERSAKAVDIRPATRSASPCAETSSRTRMRLSPNMATTPKMVV